MAWGGGSGNQETLGYCVLIIRENQEMKTNHANKM